MACGMQDDAGDGVEVGLRESVSSTIESRESETWV